MLIVISPHLDDAVFGCARLLAAHPGSIVVTVFAGAPRDVSVLTEWDARCGFASAKEAIATRRQEDSAALALLGAQPVWLDFCDSQYGQTPSQDEVREALQTVLATRVPELVLYPLGLYHSDHVLVHHAARDALQRLHGPRALVYEDALYRGMQGVLQQRLCALAAQTWCATPARLNDREDAEVLKLRAVKCYASQLRAFGSGGWDDLSQPERYWTLVPDAQQHAA